MMKTMLKLHFLLITILPLSLSACTSTCGKASSGDAVTVITSNGQEILNMAETVSEPKILVAYFSCTGNTRSVAARITDALKADIREIQPEIPYTTEDLNWRNASSRSSMENNNPSSRPAISGNIENMEQYDIVFLGYPIWWGQAPRIILTFLEGYDFSGKTIVPFCTSGSSGVGSSATNLHRLCSDSTTWMPGSLLAANSSHSGIVKWINGLELGITAE